MYRSHLQEESAHEEASLRDRDLGRFVLSLEPFDWDPSALRAIPVSAATIPEMHWQLLAPDLDRDYEPGAPYREQWLVHGEPRIDHGALIEAIEAHSGHSFLEVTRGNCAPSIIPLRHTPGYTEREHPIPTFHAKVPTCRASKVDMLEVANGTFIYGGVGEPPAVTLIKMPEYAKERRIELPTFWIDRTEVTNTAFQLFGEMADFTGVAPPQYPKSTELLGSAGPRKPVTGIDWRDARAYCRFLGKQLPTSQQWVKALRGGEQLFGSRNAMPRRNLPWGSVVEPVPARIRMGKESSSVADVGTHPGDTSPYGVLDLAGNVTEWTESKDDAAGMRIARGGNWDETTPEFVADYDAIENPRAETQRLFGLGVRCISSDPK